MGKGVNCQPPPPCHKRCLQIWISLVYKTWTSVDVSHQGETTATITVFLRRRSMEATKVFSRIKHCVRRSLYEEHGRDFDWGGLGKFFALSHALSYHERDVLDYVFKHGHKITETKWEEFKMWLTMGGGERFISACEPWCYQVLHCIKICSACRETSFEAESGEDVDLQIKCGFNPYVSVTVMEDYPYAIVKPLAGEAIPDGWGRELNSKVCGTSIQTNGDVDLGLECCGVLSGYFGEKFLDGCSRT